MLELPEDFVRTMTELHGADGLAWLGRLPAILAACAEQWGLTIGPPFVGLSYHYAAPAIRSDGTAVVVKISSPTGEFANESEALRLFNGRGAPQLLAIDAGNEVQLLEHLDPGTPLSAVENDDQAISSAAAVLRQLWRPAPSGHSFPLVADWGAGFGRLRAHFGGGTGPFPARLVEQAERLFSELNTSMAEPALLHGDLNFGNILAAQRQPWLAIDPKGLVGEPAYDTGVLLRDPLPKLLAAPQPGRILARRIDQLADELGIDRARIHGWGLSQAVLSAWWSFEDHGHGWEPAIACAALLAAITP